MTVVIIKNPSNWKYILVEESLPSVHKAWVLFPSQKLNQTNNKQTKTHLQAFAKLPTKWKKSYI